MPRALLALSLLGLLVLSGCVERYLNVRSDPPGATVYLDDQKVGETPIDLPYSWYGKRLLAVELQGYAPVREVVTLNPPWWQYFPLDFTTDVLVPFVLYDRTEVSYRLEKPAALEELEEVKKRAAELREKANTPPPKQP